jgi:hypothetical protein
MEAEMLRHVVLSTLAVIALGAATVSTPALARGGGGGGHVGGFGGGGGHVGGFGGGHFGGGGMAHVGGGVGRAFGGGNFAGPSVGGVGPLGSGAARTQFGGLHRHVGHVRRFGFGDGAYDSGFADDGNGFDACGWPWRRDWRLYCGD